MSNRNPSSLQAVKPKLSEEQYKQLQLCFSLMDADGSGNIDNEEMGNALQVCAQPT
jgi:Ca2+-binding EF-hand superfamily protein